MSDEILTPPEAAAALKLSPRTLQDWRHEGTGPRYFTFGRLVRYKRRELLLWMAKQGKGKEPQLPNALADLKTRLLNGERLVGWIYFLRGRDTGNIKIGFGRTLWDRLKRIQSHSPEPLEFMGAIPGSMAEERMLHDFFNGARLHGEWFRSDNLLLRLILDITPQFAADLPPKEVQQ